MALDPTCLVHGRKWSAHDCLYCCLCFKSLTLDECNVLPGGIKEDVCKPCAEIEAQVMAMAAQSRALYQLTDTEAVEP